MPRTIRLACIGCDREDFDAITPSELAQAIASGWRYVRREQTYAEACRTYDHDPPPGYSALAWWTHLGWCPDCADD